MFVCVQRMRGRKGGGGGGSADPFVCVAGVAGLLFPPTFCGWNEEIRDDKMMQIFCSCDTFKAAADTVNIPRHGTEHDRRLEIDTLAILAMGVHTHVRVRQALPI